MYNLSEELIDFVNVHASFKELIADCVMESVQLVVDLLTEFKAYLLYKIENDKETDPISKFAL